MSDQNRTFLDDLREGNVDTFRDNLPWDEFERPPLPATHPMWMGLYGQTIMAGGGGDRDVIVHVHDTVAEARECWDDKMARVRDAVNRRRDLEANMPSEIRELLSKLASMPGVDVGSMMVPANGDQPAEQYAIGREATAPRIGFYL